MFNKENCSSEMQLTINAFSTELKNIRTGRVSPDILKTIVIKYISITRAYYTCYSKI